MALVGEGRRHQLVLPAPGRPSLAARLAAIADGGALNLVPLSAAALATVFLPPMLPDLWRWRPIPSTLPEPSRNESRLCSSRPALDSVNPPLRCWDARAEARARLLF